MDNFSLPTGIFRWHTIDVSSFLPPRWDEEMASVATRTRESRVLRPPHSTSREPSDVHEITVSTVTATVIQKQLPWLLKLYYNEFRVLAEMLWGEQVVVGSHIRHTIVLNYQEFGDSRYECHIDTNPIQAMLYATPHDRESGGELIVSNSIDAIGPEQINASASIIYPHPGHLVFFDARHNPHYVRELLHPGAIRVAAAMNYYTRSAPESTRPPDLDTYLAGSR